MLTESDTNRVLLIIIIIIMALLLKTIGISLYSELHFSVHISKSTAFSGFIIWPFTVADSFIYAADIGHNHFGCCFICICSY